MNASELTYQALSPLVDNRVYPLFVPELADEMTPYIVYSQVSSTPYTTIDGITHHERVRIQVDIYHDDYDSALALSTDVLDALDAIASSQHESTQYIAEGGLYRAIIEYSFNHTTKTPTEE